MYYGSLPIIVGGGIGDQVFSYNAATDTLTVGTAGYPVTRMVFASATATIGMGAAPGSNAALNIDNASYAEGIRIVNSTRYVRLLTDGSNPYVEFSGAIGNIGTNSAHGLQMYTANQGKWIVGATAGESLLISVQATSRIRMGATNGIAFQNSAGTLDRAVWLDNGTRYTQSDGTRSVIIATSAASGELGSGAAYSASAGGNGNAWLIPDYVAGGAGARAGFVYWNGSQHLTVAEFANVASGFATFALVKSGGNVVIGGTAAGATANGTIAFAINGTDPTATVDLVHIYGKDRSAGNRAFACYQEAAVGAVGGAADFEWPVIINGTNYMVQLRAA